MEKSLLEIMLYIFIILKLHKNSFHTMCISVQRKSTYELVIIYSTKNFCILNAKSNLRNNIFNLCINHFLAQSFLKVFKVGTFFKNKLVSKVYI